MKKVAILFGDAHLSYSPTVIGLYDQLSPDHDVTIIAPSPASFDDKPLPRRNVVYIPEKKTNGVYRYLSRIVFEVRARLQRDVAEFKLKGMHHSRLHEFDLIKKWIAANTPDTIIAVDLKELLFMQILGKRVEFLSLEIADHDHYRERYDLANIGSVIIQTRDRYEYLFGDREFKTFYIQNAPVFDPPTIEPQRAGMVYCGTAWDPFGFYHVLGFLGAFPEYTLTVKGALLDADRQRVESEYADIIIDGRLAIDNDYLDDTEIVEYLRKFRIGFCFYNFDVEWIDNFNYYSAPSGKMFKYFAAGVPVIAQDIPGMRPITEFDCGVLIGDLTANSIKDAAAQIEADFERYSRNCLTAAKHYSFDKAVKPFLDYLANK